MSWLDQTLDELTALPAIGYLAGGTAAAEPTALACLAFVVHGRVDDARKFADALAAMQQPNGEVAVRAGEQSPGWPTSLAISAWWAVGNALRGVPVAGDVDLPLTERHRGRSLQDNIDRAVAWLLDNDHRGQAVPRSDNFGHNTELIGWAYAEQTHSWVEPTAFGVLALKATGRGNDPAAREGVAVLIDRQLPGGGLNYGNTYVLGQFIRPHIEPTGIALLALGDSTPHAPREESISRSEMRTMAEIDPSNRLAKSVAWLRRNIGPETTPLSLGWALLGLRAHGVELPQSDEWLAAAAARVESRDRSPHKLAVLALAVKGWPT